MSDPQEIDLLEFERLREEIDNRTELSNTLLQYELAALGAGIAVIGTLPAVVLGLAAVSTLLWLFWIDHTTQIYKIAAYVELKLAPRLRAEGNDLLGWERFLRDIDAGDERSERALYGTATRRKLHIQRTNWVNAYTAVLLGGTTLVLLGVYASPKAYRLFFDIGWEGAWAAMSVTHIGQIVACLAIFGVWLFALAQFCAFQATQKTIADAIDMANKRQALPPGHAVGKT